MRLLEETLSHGSHCLFILTDFLRDSDEHAKFRRQVNILTFLLYFKKGLVETHYLLVVLGPEILDHGNGLTSFALLKATGLWAHVPSDCADFIGFVVTIASHDDCMFEFVVNGFLGFFNCRDFSSESLSFVCKSDHLLIDQLKTVVD